MRNRYEVKDDYTIIFVKTKGIEVKCIIDTEDFEKVDKDVMWYASPTKNGKSYYVSCRSKHVSGYIHRFIMESSDGKFIDHIDGDPLNNRKSNLRLVTSAQNSQNLALCKRNKTGYRGVYFEKSTGRYGITFRINGKSMYFGSWDDVHLAGKIAHQIVKNFMPYANQNRDKE